MTHIAHSKYSKICSLLVIFMITPLLILVMCRLKSEYHHMEIAHSLPTALRSTGVFRPVRALQSGVCSGQSTTAWEGKFRNSISLLFLSHLCQFSFSVCIIINGCKHTMKMLYCVNSIWVLEVQAQKPFSKGVYCIKRIETIALPHHWSLSKRQADLVTFS